ncbi:3-phosphoshikimate 1-carboxyvinyltransferase [Poriferisphaera corsica]|uniref:3-phosphoshikimate 1-carboxyvinyltransferase n=1 Tax=Poriferisphaera corsica TaxID=2528020 RepID=A0A517YV80_9BACT|nr:3-phosphoshikimate 1-carboxyvinyltransferase [Poriferisphaera corsica]QDU34116.1 3-phosphoshikimate 1-carboxyvinyltransferase [Poriferisphaera corsica]
MSRALPDRLMIVPFSKPFDATGDRAVIIPGSKSLTNRALLLAALADGETTLRGVLFSDDTERMLEGLASLGFQVGIDREKCIVNVKGCNGQMPKRSEQDVELFLGNAGTATRFMTAAMTLASENTSAIITGIPRMLERPIGELVEPLRQLGAKIEYLGEEGYPPIRVHGLGKGIMRGGDLVMKPTVSSQYLSALLQIGPYLHEGLTMIFDGPVTSLPYVKMTVELMRQFGAKIDTTDDWSIISVKPGGYQGNTKDIEPDASNASYAMGMAAATQDAIVEIKHLSENSLQGDAAFAKELAKMGADVQYLDDAIIVRGTGKLKGIDADFNAIPDMVQTIAVVALFAKGETTIRDVGNLRIKETDRMAALKNELTKLGATVKIVGDDITIIPPDQNKLKHPNGQPITESNPAVIETYDDHRMAMSFAIAGTKQVGVVIDDPACVNKTFPTYFEQLSQLNTAAQRQ